MVLTVPMRNGNNRFTYAIAIITYVLTVPMRNGNQYQPYYSTSSKILFLPYLWGMETEQSFIIRIHKHSSYRTYEEWKLLRELVSYEIRCKGSYRTYEEWKLWIYNSVCIGVEVLTVPMRNGNSRGSFPPLFSYSGSYRTYEEWKHRYIWVGYWEKSVLTVPMRNGNEIVEDLGNGHFVVVLTVPMRNGN